MRDITACLFANKYVAIKRETYDSGRGSNSRSKVPEYKKRIVPR